MMPLFLYQFILLFFLIGICEFFRKNVKISFFLFTIFLICTSHLYIYKINNYNDYKAVWFTYTKLFLVLTSIYIGFFVRWNQNSLKNYQKIMIYSIFFLNILIALFLELMVKAEFYQLNIFSAFVLLLSLNEYKSINLSNDDSKDIEWNCIDKKYIIAYTLWNLSFVYSNFPGIILQHSIVLLSPILLSIFYAKKNNWLFYRSISLGLFLLFSIYMDSSSIDLVKSGKNFKIEQILAFSSFFFSLFLLSIKLKIFKLFR